MKKLLAILLALSLTLALSACAAKADDPAEKSLRIVFAEEPLTKETEYKDDDGTVLLIEKYELPLLEVRTAANEIYESPLTNNTEGIQPVEVAVRDAFNAEMRRVAEELDASAQEALAMAREHYAGLDAEQRSYWGNYAEELMLRTICRHDGLVSIWCDGYANYGGAHGSSYLKAWNFDLTTGEFLTFDTLGEEGSDALRERISEIILTQIDEQGLQEWYFDDFDSYVRDLFYAVFYLDANGMTVEFDPAIIAPYAAGSQVFEIPYDEFSDLLSAHVREILGLDHAAEPVG